MDLSQHVFVGSEQSMPLELRLAEKVSYYGHEDDRLQPQPEPVTVYTPPIFYASVPSDPVIIEVPEDTADDEDKAATEEGVASSEPPVDPNWSEETANEQEVSDDETKEPEQVSDGPTG